MLAIHLIYATVPILGHHMAKDTGDQTDSTVRFCLGSNSIFQQLSPTQLCFLELIKLLAIGQNRLMQVIAR